MTTTTTPPYTYGRSQAKDDCRWCVFIGQAVASYASDEWSARALCASMNGEPVNAREQWATVDAYHFARVALWYWFREKSEEWYCAGWDAYTLTRAQQIDAEGDLPPWVRTAIEWAGWPDENLSWEGVGSFDECPERDL